MIRTLACSAAMALAAAAANAQTTSVDLRIIERTGQTRVVYSNGPSSPEAVLNFAVQIRVNVAKDRSANLTLATDCTGQYARFTGSGLACNAPGNTSAPCCRADFNGEGLSVQDIFDFLNAWFAGCP